MWYFTWVLGTSLAASFGVLNAMWLEIEEDSVNSSAGPEHESETD